MGVSLMESLWPREMLSEEIRDGKMYCISEWPGAEQKVFALIYHLTDHTVSFYNCMHKVSS